MFWVASHFGPSYDQMMTHAQLVREIKKTIEKLPPDRLESLADYVHYLNRPSLPRRLASAEQAIATGKGVPWRKVRRDV
jgi:hypothetical protein